MDWKTIAFDTLDSTNAEAKRMLQHHAAGTSLHGTVIVAEQQTNGTGRLGRAWDSPRGTGLWFTVILQPQIAISQASLFSFAAAVSTAEAIRQLTELPVKLKWPNDILLEGKKLCGILLELIPNTKNNYYLAIGIGINVNQQQKDFPPDLSEKATSIAIASNRYINRTELLSAILTQLQINSTLLETQGFAPLRDKWKFYNCVIGREVSVQQYGKELFSGVAEDLAMDGTLLVRTENGIQSVFAGDVSLRTKTGTYFSDFL